MILENACLEAFVGCVVRPSSPAGRQRQHRDPPHQPFERLRSTFRRQRNSRAAITSGLLECRRIQGAHGNPLSGLATG